MQEIAKNNKVVPALVKSCTPEASYTIEEAEGVKIFKRGKDKRALRREAQRKQYEQETKALIAKAAENFKDRYGIAPEVDDAGGIPLLRADTMHKIDAVIVKASEDIVAATTNIKLELPFYININVKPSKND